MKRDEKPRKQPKQARSQAMVESILAAAARVLAQRGYARTNTNLVAEAAGISVGSLYQYFPNKDALFVALHKRHEQHMQSLLETSLSQLLAQGQLLSLRQAIASLIRTWIQIHQLEPELHRTLEAEFAFFEPDEDLSSGERRIQAGIRSLLELHQTEIGQPNLALATYLVMKTIEAHVHALVIEPPAGLEPQALEAGLLDTVMGGLLSQPKAAYSNSKIG